MKVTIGRTAEGVRGIFTTEEVLAGEPLIIIPDHLVLSVKNVAAAEAAPVLLKEMFLPCSRLKPYMDMLPKLGEVLTGYNFPEEYIKYLADPSMEDMVTQSFKRHAKATFKGQNNNHMEMTIPEAIGREDLNLTYWEHVVSLLSSRTFTIRKAALSMVPVIDLANHDPADINRLDSTTPDGVRLIAGKDLKPGEEVTITYGNMRSDELLLYYGFIDQLTKPPKVFLVDHRDYIPYEVTSMDEDPPLMGPLEDVVAETARLRKILAAFEGRLAGLGPLPDSNPYLRDTIKQLHAQRREAIIAEVARLEALAEVLRAGGGQADAGEGEGADDEL
ncbi:hypothetical protein HYH03_009374 [Edaphochlamys debaryana]|uniref:SET domain-containing protein n=1 Tax=Edaphochlamys debaryana TaxID=47281 RepID=A0A836BX71_9CHLO|nr:hypothetical protein HYH03_009374 [Edaphochlamys debaryana]|eukprot:KAG2492431.1 hypothetical protein HYH03_009374 [Edaphochlamys debaryana]